MMIEGGMSMPNRPVWVPAPRSYEEIFPADYWVQIPEDHQYFLETLTHFAFVPQIPTRADDPLPNLFAIPFRERCTALAGICDFRLALVMYGANRGAKYRKKDEAWFYCIKNQCANEFAWRAWANLDDGSLQNWGVGPDDGSAKPHMRGEPVLYCDLPGIGQVSFHVGQGCRVPRRRYPQDWIGIERNYTPLSFNHLDSESKAHKLLRKPDIPMGARHEIAVRAGLPVWNRNTRTARY